MNIVQNLQRELEVRWHKPPCFGRSGYMLYDVNTKTKHDKRVIEMLDKGFIFPNNMKPYSFEQAKSVTTEIVNYYCKLFTMILQVKMKCNIQQ